MNIDVIRINKQDIMTKRAGCIIHCDGRFLVVHHPSSGFWGFPKGKIDKGEGPEEAALREVHEETGLLLQRTQLGKCFRCNDGKYYVVDIEYTPRVRVDQLEIDAHMWVEFLEIYCLETSNVTKKLLEKIKQHGLGFQHIK
jgi:8-oxo-dGTP pyrophosphatase MutT (NUDIX family)